ncbi:MAG: ComEC/Rec2 family competence protein [Solidesulfovibrio sp. DCME]|uniref:ComEC/Rec2 family competence protein n=1 Tax=Solidesulfovibrio sp. DCME TaxID=3447380 RepID=UPI003D0E7E67
MVCYHEDDSKNFGVRYVLSGNVEEVNELFGRSYEISPEDFNTAESENGSRLIDFPGNFERANAIEQTMQRVWQENVQTALGRAILTAERDVAPFELDGGVCWAKIHTFNVGQGDTIVVEFPGNVVWLVDARLRGDVRVFFENWMNENFGDDVVVDKLIVSHMHYDHIMSVPYVVKRFNVSEVLVPNSLHHKTASACRVLSTAGEKLRVVEDVVLCRFGEVEALIIPTISVRCVADAIRGSRDPNDHALVLVVRSSGAVAFLAGDVRGDYCFDILRNNSIGRLIDFYKVSHHGSSTGYDNGLYTNYSFGFSMISCGRTNRYGHPHRLILNSLPSNHQVTYNMPREYDTFNFI